MNAAIRGQPCTKGSLIIVEGLVSAHRYMGSAPLPPLRTSLATVKLRLLNRRPSSLYLHFLRGRGTRDNFHQFARDDGLAGAVEEDLVLVDHLAGVLGGILMKVECQRNRRQIEHVLFRLLNKKSKGPGGLSSPDKNYQIKKK